MLRVMCIVMYNVKCTKSNKLMSIQILTQSQIVHLKFAGIVSSNSHENKFSASVKSPV